MANWVRKLASLFEIDTRDPILIRAQTDALARQLPLMYFILLFSSWALAFTHLGTAPDWLTIYIPAVLTLFGARRAINWIRYCGQDHQIEDLISRLNGVNRLSVLLSLFFTGWSIAMFGYGDAYQKSHVAFYMSITVISCIFCLSYLPQAAKIVTFVVNGTFIFFFISQNVPFFSASALNVTIVCVGMSIIMDINNKNFRGMIKEQQKSLKLIRENERLANIDSLTGLGNRRAFYAGLEACLEDQIRTGRSIAAGIIDLDGFKPVNDLYGHQVGDKLLQAVADKLEIAERDTADYQLYRLGGDEFAFIVWDLSEPEVLQYFGQQLCEALKAPFKIGELTVVISGTVGIATRTDQVTTAAELLDQADHALYRGKRVERGTCQLFSMDHAKGFHREAEILQTLKTANLAQEIHPVFQPIVDIRNRKVIALEALARWKSPELGWVAPFEFIPIAEQAGIIGEITCSMFKKALDEAANWPSDIHLSFNLSAHDLSSELTLLKLMKLLSQSRFQPQNIEFEVTETALGDDMQHAHRMLDELRQMGCSISLDDFGTGYSNLSRLHALPLKKIKIDRSFITGIYEGSTNFKIVKSLLTFAKDMQLDCIIEGVETAEELKILEGLGVDYVQGYFFSPPVKSDLVVSVVQSIQENRKAA